MNLWHIERFDELRDYPPKINYANFGRSTETPLLRRVLRELGDFLVGDGRDLRSGGAHPVEGQPGNGLKSLLHIDIILCRGLEELHFELAGQLQCLFVRHLLDEVRK